MINSKTMNVLVLLIILLALVATLSGIFSSQGPGPHQYTSINGQKILIYGKGIYQNMSASLAPDGIAQDIVTLLIAVPLLIFSFLKAKKNCLAGKLLLAGVLLYFLFTYLLYMVLIMYNQLFLVYVLLTSLSFFALAITIISFDIDSLADSFKKNLPLKYIGGFLIFVAIMVAMSWLGRIVPPLIDGSVIPQGLDHYTTIPVQALDLAFMLPLAFLSGFLLIKRKAIAYLMAPIITNFLIIMMLAISAKIFGQFIRGTAGTLPIMIIFVVFAVIAVSCSISIRRNIKTT